MPLTREEAIEVARNHAFSYRDQHTYLPQNSKATDAWEPHEWVIQAIIGASRSAS